MQVHSRAKFAFWMLLSTWPLRAVVLDFDDEPVNFVGPLVMIVEPEQAPGTELGLRLNGEVQKVKTPSGFEIAGLDYTIDSPAFGADAEPFVRVEWYSSRYFILSDEADVSTRLAGNTKVNVTAGTGEDLEEMVKKDMRYWGEVVFIVEGTLDGEPVLSYSKTFNTRDLVSAIVRDAQGEILTVRWKPLEIGWDLTGMIPDVAAGLHALDMRAIVEWQPGGSQNLSISSLYGRTATAPDGGSTMPILGSVIALFAVMTQQRRHC